MKFSEKNNFIVKHGKDKKYFEKDLELFKQHCPSSRLHVELKRANSFNKHILQGKMLYELLDKCTPEEIWINRGIEELIITTAEQVDEILIEMNVDKAIVPSVVLDSAIGKTKTAFDVFVRELLSAPLEIETLETTGAVFKFLEAEFPEDEFPMEIIDFLVGKTKGDILDFITFGQLFIANTKENVSTEKETISAAANGGASETPGTDTQEGTQENTDDNNENPDVESGEGDGNFGKFSEGAGKTASDDNKVGESGTVDSDTSDTATVTEEAKKAKTTAAAKKKETKAKSSPK